MSIKNHLFSTDQWSMVAARQRALMEEELGTLDGDRLLNTSIHDLSNYFAEKYSIKVPLLQRDNILVSQRETQIDLSSDRTRYSSERNRPLLVTGTLVEVAIPFEGDAFCFTTQPTSYIFNVPRGEVEDNSLIFHIEGVDLLPEQVRAQIQQAINDVTQNLKFLRTDTDRFNSNLYAYAHSLIAQRRRKLLTDRNLVSGLGFKLRPRSDDSVQSLTPDERRTITPELPPASAAPFTPEPLLTAKEYTRILAVMQKSARLLEYSPSLVAALDETALRSLFLIHVNGHFVGKTSRELFGYSGPTDFSIRVEGRNIFVAECRIWAGPVSLIESLDQLLAHEGWRDNKAALILLYRGPVPSGQGLAQPLDLMRETIKSHANFKRELPPLSESIFPYLFAQRNFIQSDARSRETLITVLAIDLPSSSDA